MFRDCARRKKFKKFSPKTPWGTMVSKIENFCVEFLNRTIFIVFSMPKNGGKVQKNYYGPPPKTRFFQPKNSENMSYNTYFYMGKNYVFFNF
jgi:hypothetical protein